MRTDRYRLLSDDNGYRIIADVFLEALGLSTAD